MSKALLKDIISLQFSTSDSDFCERVLSSSNYVSDWVLRVLNNLNFTDYKSSIAQKIPDN